jgi:uncharacterized protein (DUF3820 family)
MTMPQGKYRGKELVEVPGSYLAWALEEARLYRDLGTRIKDEFARGFVQGALPPSRSPGKGSIPSVLRPIAQELVKAGFRRLALIHHPDHGGSVDAMRLVLEGSRVLEVLIDRDHS